MKHKFTKVLGVFATLLAVASILVSGIPVAAAAQAWEKIETPANNGQINGRVKWVGPMEKAINGDLYVAVGLGDNICDDDDDEDMEVWLYKSTAASFGRTWTKLGQQPFDSEISVNGYPGVVFDIETSPTNANVLYVTDGYDIYKSINGGSTWVVLDGLFDEVFSLGAVAQGLIVSIAVSSFGGTSYVFAATSTFGGGAGGLYALQESIFVSEWIDLEVWSARENPFLSVDVLAVDTLPDFTTNQGLVAVVSAEVDDDEWVTLVTTRFMASEWAENAADCILEYNLDNGDTEEVTDTLLDATIWFPSDFSSDAEGGNWVLYVGINPMNDIEQGDVFQCFGGAPDDDDEPMAAIDLDVRGQASGTAVSDMDGVGSWVSADLLVSGYTENIFVPHTWASQDGGVTWFQDAKRPTGGLSPLYPRALSSVRVHPNFATNGLALVGTHGLDAGLSVSYLPTDVCATGFTWNTIYFIATCVDQKVDMSIANDNTVYLTTFDEIDDESTTGTEADWICFEAIYYTDPLTEADSVVIGPLVGAFPADGNAVVFLTVVEGGVEFDDDGSNAIIQWLTETEAVITFYSDTDVAILVATEDDTRIILTPEAPGIFGAPAVNVDLDADVVIGGSDATFWIIDLGDAATTEENRQVTTFTLDVEGSVLIFSDDEEEGEEVTDEEVTIVLGDDEDMVCIFPITDAELTLIDPEAGEPIDGPTPDITSSFDDEEEEEFVEVADLLAGLDLAAGTQGTFTPGALLYSAWRYMDTTGDGVRDWERVNSYSLYLPEGFLEEGEDLVQFDFVRTTPENTAVVLVDRSDNTIYRSINRGNLWTMNSHRVPTLNGYIHSVLLLSPTAMLVGVENGIVYYSNFPGTWFARDAFGTSSVDEVTDLRRASNGDIIVAGVGNDGDVFVTRSVAAANNTTFTVWPSGSAVDTGVDVDAWAFAAPAADYATSGVIYVTSDIAGIYYRTYTGTASWTRADADEDWYNSDGAFGSFEEESGPLEGNERFLTNLQTAPGGPGLAAEGVGMAYLTSSSEDDEISSGVARIKGRSSSPRAAELIRRPTGVNVEGLWAGPASVGSVILYAFGSDCNIWWYTDTLNQAITGVNVPAASIYVEECPTCPTTFQAQVRWTALANVSHYFVYITSGDQVQNVYQALADVAEDGDFAFAAFTSGTSVNITGFPSQTTFNVSVWGIRTGTLAGTLQEKAEDVIEAFSLTSFGGGASFTTPPPTPIVLGPAAGAGAVPTRPTFQWQAVPNATSYTLTVDDNADFSSPVKTVTTTSTAYAWAAADPALTYSTTYYWRVVATTPAGASIAAVNAFTTAPAPVTFPSISIPPQITPTVNITVNVPQATLTVPLPVITVVVPTLTIPQITIPTPTFNIPQATVIIPTQPPVATPAYIWVIVAVGAILTIAVIVLIIRTRRVV